MRQIVGAVKFCCLGDSPLEKITIGGATSEPTVLQPPWFYVLWKYTWNIEDDLLNMRSIKNERFYIFIPLGKSTPTISSQGLLWRLSGKESSCWCRNHGFDLWSGRIPYAVEQLNSWATTIEPVLWTLELQLLQPVCPRAGALHHQQKPHPHPSRNEKPAQGNQRKACTVAKTQYNKN